MSAITVTAASVRPLPGSQPFRFAAGGSINVGDVVYVSGNDTVKQASGTLLAMANAVGLCVATNAAGGTLAASGDYVDVVTYGPVTGFSSMTAGNLHYVSDTDGKVDTAAGTKDTIIGYAINASTLFVRPRVIDLS